MPRRLSSLAKSDAIGEIAKRELGVSHFAIANVDSLDFVEVSRGALRRALEAAFEAGRKAAS